MTPAARLSAAIEVLDIYLGGHSVEKALTNWGRRSRFAGSKDRASVRDTVFDCLRRRNSCALRGNGLTGRGLVLGLLHKGNDRAAIEALFSGEGHAPHPLTEAEATRLYATKFKMGWDAVLDMPNWVLPELDRSFEDTDLKHKVCHALKDRAPVFLRVNLKRVTRTKAIMALAKDGVVAQEHGLAASALVVVDNPRKVAGSKAYADGLVELQDAASQAVCAGLPPAKRMLDYCAGGGGKVLAYGDLNDAALFAHDANAGRLRDLEPRAKRAGLKVNVLDRQGCGDAAPFDLVLCDVPCSGSGAWRRSPEGKWALTAAALAQLHEIQAGILDDAQGLVSPGGQLCYVTCSFFSSENTAQILSFVERYSDFTVTFQHQYLPNEHGDGLFVAHLTRDAAAI